MSSAKLSRTSKIPMIFVVPRLASPSIIYWELEARGPGLAADSRIQPNLIQQSGVCIVLDPHQETVEVTRDRQRRGVGRASSEGRLPCCWFLESARSGRLGNPARVRSCVRVVDVRSTAATVLNFFLFLLPAVNGCLQSWYDGRVVRLSVQYVYSTRREQSVWCV